MDYDQDGKLNFMEFSDHAYEIYKNYLEYETGGVQVPSAEEKFAELDLNKDKYTYINKHNFLTTPQEVFFLTQKSEIKV